MRDLRCWGLSEGQVARQVRDGALSRIARGCTSRPRFRATTIGRSVALRTSRLSSLDVPMQVSSPLEVPRCCSAFPWRRCGASRDHSTTTCTPKRRRDHSLYTASAP